MRILLKSKINSARVTEAEPDYVGSITIGEDLMEKADLWEGEQVLVASKQNGARLFTYVIKGKPGVICMNGPASKLVKKGDEIVILAFEITDKKINAKNIVVNQNNRFVRFL